MSPNTTPSAPTTTAGRTASTPPTVRGGDSGSERVYTVRSPFSRTAACHRELDAVAAWRIDPKLALTVRAQSSLQRSPVSRCDHISMLVSSLVASHFSLASGKEVVHRCDTALPQSAAERCL